VYADLAELFLRLLSLNRVNVNGSFVVMRNVNFDIEAPRDSLFDERSIDHL